jgi:hypothetical protein
MKLREQNLLKRQIANKKAKEEAEKAEQIQKYLDDITPEVLADYQTVIENLKTFCQQNPNEPVFMANVSEVGDLSKFLFGEKPDAKTLATVLYDYGGVCFLDQKYNPIDGKNVKIIEITKIVEIPVKKADAEISQNKLDKIIKKTLYEFKGKNPMLVDGANQFCETFLKQLSKI